MSQVYQEVEKKHGKKIDLAHKSTYNPKTKRYFAFSDSYVPDPGNCTRTGGPTRVSRMVPIPGKICGRAKRIRDKSGHPCGLVSLKKLDTSMAMRALLWSLAVPSRMKPATSPSFQGDHRSPEIHEGSLSGIRNSGGVHLDSAIQQPSHARRPRFLRRECHLHHSPVREGTSAIDAKIMISQALNGPVRRIAAEHVMDCYIIWTSPKTRTARSNS